MNISYAPRVSYHWRSIQKHTINHRTAVYLRWIYKCYQRNGIMKRGEKKNNTELNRTKAPQIDGTKQKIKKRKKKHNHRTMTLLKRRHIRWSNINRSSSEQMQSGLCSEYSAQSRWFERQTQTPDKTFAVL